MSKKTERMQLIEINGTLTAGFGAVARAGDVALVPLHFAHDLRVRGKAAFLEPDSKPVTVTFTLDASEKGLAE